MRLAVQEKWLSMEKEETKIQRLDPMLMLYACPPQTPVAGDYPPRGLCKALSILTLRKIYLYGLQRDY